MRTKEDILWLDVDGNEKDCFDNLNHASSATGINYSNIYRAVHTQKPFYSLQLKKFFYFVRRSDRNKLKPVPPISNLRIERPVSLYNANTGERICNFVNVNQAHISNLGYNMIYRGVKSRGEFFKDGQFFIYTDEATPGRIKELCKLYKKQQPQVKSNRKVVQLNKTMEIIATYDSITQAASALGIPYNNIYSCLHNICRTSGGYIWKYDDDSIFDLL